MATSLEDMRTVPVHTLATWADCGMPDDEGSTGGLFLAHVRRSVVDAVMEGRFDLDHDDSDDRDTIAEIIDNAPDVYTHTRWLEFVDLTAYNEDPEAGEWPEDLTQAAGVALLQIADRLAVAILAELREWSQDQDDDGEQLHPGDDDDTGTMPPAIGSAPAQV